MLTGIATTNTNVFHTNGDKRKMNLTLVPFICHEYSDMMCGVEGKYYSLRTSANCPVMSVISHVSESKSPQKTVGICRQL